MARRYSFFMAPIDHGFLRWLDDLWRGWLTPAGRRVAGAAVAGLVLLLGGVAPLLVWTTASLLSALGCAALLGLLLGARPRLRLVRRLGPPVCAGEILDYAVEVENVGRRPARLVTLQERGLPAELRPDGEPAPIPLLAPGERAVLRLRLRCGRRGAFTLPCLQASSAFPGALVKWSRRSGGAERVLVYPRPALPEGLLLPLGRTHQPGGVAEASRVGDSTELLGARDFRDGDRPRDVHWPSTARTGRLIVKEYQEEYFVRLALVVDTEARTARTERNLERAIGLAAGIADREAQRELLLEIFAAGQTVHRLTAGRALASAEQVLELLSCLEPERRLDVGALSAELLPEASRLSAAVLLFVHWDDARARLVAALRERGVAIRALLVGVEPRPGDLLPEERVEVA
jgi:uncharacterized protein (DUF58 family)